MLGYCEFLKLSGDRMQLLKKIAGLILLIGSIYILFGGCMFVNIITILALYALVIWLFDFEWDSDLSVYLIVVVIASALSYVWHNSDLARSLGVDCHLWGDLMDTRSDLFKYILDL
jgi:thiol:disulfide interchange protein